MKKLQIKQSEVKTQIEKVLWHLQKYGTITTWEAFNTYRIMRLGSIIDVLRNKQHYHIETELIEHKLASDNLFPNARNGKGQHAKYIYKEVTNNLIGTPAFVSQKDLDKDKKEETKSFFGKFFTKR